jgi:predicted TIM-barrel fold metal-dependent hydrolase
MIVDVHAHIFHRLHGQIASGPTVGLGWGRARMGADGIQMTPPMGPETAHPVEALIANMDWAGVDRAVLLQGTYYGQVNAYARAAVQRYPDRLSAAAFVDPWLPGAQRTFARLMDTGAYCALKIEFSVGSGFKGLHPTANLDEPDLDWLWQELVRRDKTLVLDLGWPSTASYQTAAVRDIAQAHPDLRVVICHLGWPGPAAEADPGLWLRWQEQVDLGCLANVWFDFAALPLVTPAEDFPFPRVARYLQMAVERIGAGKVMWGTDVPSALASASYPQLLRAAQLHLQFLTSVEQAQVLGGTAQKVFGLAST